MTVNDQDNLQSSLMEAVVYSDKLRNTSSSINLHRSSSLNSCQSLCSTSLSTVSSSNYDNGELSPEYLMDMYNIPLLPEEDAEEDWRMFGWLLDSSEAAERQSCSYENTSCSSIYSPLQIDVYVDEKTGNNLKRKAYSTSTEGSEYILKSKNSLSFVPRPWWKRLNNNNVENERNSVNCDEDIESYCDKELFENRRITRSMANYFKIKRRRKTGAEYPSEGEEEEIKSEIQPTVEDKPIFLNNETITVKTEPTQDVDYEILPTSEFTSSPVRTSARQASRTKRLSPGVEMSLSKNVVPSICVNGVSIISSIDVKDIRKSKPGRPSNKEKRKMQRHIEAQRRKLIKSGISQEGAIDFDINANHCVCRQPYDAKKFYLACNKCKCWFHGKCIGLTEKKAKRLKEWFCAECEPNYKIKKSKKLDETSNEKTYEETGLFCLCQEPYDCTRNYIGCDKCNDWFHFECVNVTAEKSKTMSEYICPRCE